jgi:hypothetical protein
VPIPSFCSILHKRSGRYQTRCGSIAQFQTLHTTSTTGHRDQLATVNRELKDISAAVDRYLIAFEKGHLDDDNLDIRARLATLKAQSTHLRARKAQLEFDLDQPPTAPTPSDLNKIHSQIREILTQGTPQARKALFEALIQEIQIHSDDTLTPIFRLPLAGHDEGLALNGPAHDQTERTGSADAVRALPTMVGDTGIEPVTSSVSVRTERIA